MEDVYTIKVKTKPDTRNLYPSERRYSASTVSGLAWVHIALAATSFLLACLAFINPNSDINPLTLNNTEQTVNNNDLINLTDTDADVTANVNNTDIKSDSNYMLLLAPSLLTIFALAAGIASILASVRWYIDRNITFLFIMSVFSTIFSLVSLIIIAAWFITTEQDISMFYKDKEPFQEYFILKHSDVIAKNDSHLLVAKNSMENVTDTNNSHNMFTKRVLAINILIASFLELLWSILSVKISYKGMRNTYNEDVERRGNCVSVVTKIKGNNTKKLPRNVKLIPPKQDIIDNYPSTKIKRIFLAQSDNGFYLKNHNNKNKNTETSSEFYKERMMSFLNRCASTEMSNSVRTPSVHSEAVLNPIPELTKVEINQTETETIKDTNTQGTERERVTPVSWGDSPDHTVYNQNTLNFEKIFTFAKQSKEDEEENINDSN